MVTSKSAEVGDRILKVTFCFILMEEIWRDVVGYEGLYQVSNLGRIKSLGFDKWHKERILKTCLYKGFDYIFVGLHKKGERTKRKDVHRLVAEAFVPNPLNLPQVNHKDECKTNNCAENLEWCNASYNMKYGTAMKRAIESRRKNNDINDIVRRIKETKRLNNSFSCERPVNQFTWQGKFVKRYISATDAERQTGISRGGIVKSCIGVFKQAKGFIWLYDEDVKNVSSRIMFASAQCKKVAQYSLDGTLIKIWNSCKDACDTLNFNKGGISECCNGKRKSYKNFIWKFFEQ